MTSRDALAQRHRPSSSLRFSSLRASFVSWALILLVGLSGLTQAVADPASSFGNPAAPSVPTTAPNARYGAPFETSQGTLHLTAVLTANDQQPIRAGLKWRVFNEALEQDSSHKLVAESSDATPTLPLPDGSYIVHAGLGLAGVTKRVVINGQTVSEKLVLNAGALRIIGLLGDVPINPTKLSVAIYVPERGNSEAKLVFANAKAGDTI